MNTTVISCNQIIFLKRRYSYILGIMVRWVQNAKITFQNSGLNTAQHFLSVVAELILAGEQEKSRSVGTRLHCDFRYCFFFLYNEKVLFKSGCH